MLNAMQRHGVKHVLWLTLRVLNQPYRLINEVIDGASEGLNREKPRVQRCRASGTSTSSSTGRSWRGAIPPAHIRSAS
jgi:hypothetical protein